MQDPRNLLSDVLQRAKAAGADAVDLLYLEEQSRSARVRLGKTESIDAAEAAQLGLRLFIGKQQAIVASTDLSAGALNDLIDRAINMARLAPADPYCGLADAGEIMRDPPVFDSCDSTIPETAALAAMTKDMEAAALAVPGVTNSDEAEGSWSSSKVHILQSNGFAGSYQRSYFSLSVAVVAGRDTAMERDFDYTVAVYQSDMLPPDAVGKRAGERAVRRLGARKMPTGKIPVVFAPRVATSLIGHLTSAINGAAIARGTSFLKDKRGQPVFPRGFSIIDDPHRRRGLRSRPFDAEGIATQRRALIDDGVLTTWLLDLRSARQLGLSSTGHASRGTGGPPSPGGTNIHIAAGQQTPDELIRDIKAGFYVTELIGMGVNGVTGDYSRGAAGFWIENGVMTHPVNEMTIAGNLNDMFKECTPANDLELRLERESPTLRIDGMTVAGL